MTNKAKSLVYEILKNDNSGHGIDHIERVLNLSLKFCEEEKGNIEIVTLIALLHDVDDYKLFGSVNADKLMNARKILDKLDIDDDIKEEVLDNIKCIGFNKRLKGLIPLSLEGKIVSDADMCDALGVTGILRTYQYSLKHNKPFFDKDIYPIENINSSNYNRVCSDTSVCHIFEKILKLKGLMLTNSGLKEADIREKIVIDILYNLFYEENVNEWKNYLDKYLRKRK